MHKYETRIALPTPILELRGLHFRRRRTSTSPFKRLKESSREYLKRRVLVIRSPAVAWHFDCERVEPKRYRKKSAPFRKERDTESARLSLTSSCVAVRLKQRSIQGQKTTSYLHKNNSKGSNGTHQHLRDARAVLRPLLQDRSARPGRLKEFIVIQNKPNTKSARLSRGGREVLRPLLRARRDRVVRTG